MKHRLNSESCKENLIFIKRIRENKNFLNNINSNQITMMQKGKKINMKRGLNIFKNYLIE